MLYKEFEELFPSELSAIEYFIKIRYPDGVICPHCGGRQLIYRRKDEPKMFDCKHCDNTFSIMRDTIFEKSSTDMKMWFYAINTMLNGKKGISGRQLQREIGVTYKCAWRMLNRIRTAMGNEQERERCLRLS